jgi:hypothetical protein
VRGLLQRYCLEDLRGYRQKRHQLNAWIRMMVEG